MRSEGSFLLAQTAQSHEYIAAQLGVARSAVTQWLSGVRKPGKTNRGLLLEHFGIPVDAWSRPPRRKVPVADSLPLSDSMYLSAEGRVRDQLRRIDAHRRELEESGNLTPQLLVRLMDQEAKATAQLSKLTGEGRVITESRILQTAAWKRIVKALLQVLGDYPEASARVVEALKGFEP